MDPQTFTLMVTVFVIGLFLGSNLAVLLMCILSMAKQSPVGEIELVPMPMPVDR